MNNKIKQALDTNLSGLRASHADYKAIMERIQGGTKVKKKMSLGLVLALILIMLSVAALAAVLLSGRDVVDQLIEPKALESTETNWFTKEEVEEIITEAEKHGVTLDDEALRQIRRSGGYFKEELAMAFSREAFGGNFYTWDVADQLWFEEFWVRIGDLVYTLRTVPQEGELSQDEIEAAAAAYIEAQTGKSYPIHDRSLYMLERSFTAVKDNPYHVTRSWTLDYTPLDLDLPEFKFILTPQGEILSYRDSLTMLENADAMTRAQYLSNRYSHLYSDRYGATDWPQEAWQGLHLALRDLITEEDVTENYEKSIGYTLRQSYSPFGPETIDREKAISIAAEAISDTFKVDQQKLLVETDSFSGYGEFIYAIGLNGDSAPVWKVSFARDYLAEIDALTGEVLTADQYSPGNDYYRRYVLDALIPEEGKAFATQVPVQPTLSPQALSEMEHTPYFKRNDSFGNDTYWEAMLGLNYTGNTATRIWSEPVRDYGEDKRFWTLVMQAFSDLYEQKPLEGGAYAGIPLGGDLPQEKALSIAASALETLSETYLSRERRASLKAAAGFMYDSPEGDSRSWRIYFMDVNMAEALPYVTFTIDAPSGELKSILIENHGHGDEGFEAMLGPDGRPLVWRSDKLPDYYWDYMEANYPTVEAAKAYLDTMPDPGPDSPVEARAVTALWFSRGPWHEGPPFKMVGLPGADDLTQSKAKEIAWTIFKQEAAPIFGEEAVNAAQPSVSFVFDDNYPDGPVWVIEFFDSSRGTSGGFGDITLDAKTGEPLNVYIAVTNG